MLKGEPQMHTTMFGTLNSIDMRRKWSIWQIPSPYAAICINSGVRTQNIGPPVPGPPIPQTAPAITPPIPVPDGTGVAWVYPTISSPGRPVSFGTLNPAENTSAGGSNSGAASNGIVAFGEAAYAETGGGFDNIHVEWSGFALAPGALPADAVITNIIPTIEASGRFDFSTGTIQYHYLNGFNSFASIPDGDFGPAQYHGNPVEIPPSLNELPFLSVTMDLRASIPSFNLTPHDQIAASAVGFAIYYTSATPTIETVVPLPLPPIPGPPVPQPVFTATNLDEEIYICNGRQNSKIYTLDELVESDDGTIIDSLYTTAGLVEGTKRQQTPGAGWGRMRFGYMVASLESLGTINVRLLPNVLLGPNDSTAGYNDWTIPGGFSPGRPNLNDTESSLNFVGTRTFLEFRENDGHGFSMSNLVLHAKKDPWNALRGAK